MSNLLNANLPSEDEEDQDYVPDEVDAEERGGKSKKPKRMRGAAAGAGAAAAACEEEGGGSEASGLEDEEDLLPESKREAKKAKVDALWSQLNRAAPAAGPMSKVAGTASLASLCKQASRGKSSADEAWMRQLGLGSKCRAAGQPGAEHKKSAAAAALAAAKAAASVAGAHASGTVTVAETRRFAGQTITVNREVAKGSKEAQRAAAAADAAAAERKQAGLDAVLASLQQAKKVTVLDKSRADWKDFKKGDDAVEEELEMHKRSGDQYLDKQAFLQAAELRAYERERDQRLASDVRNRGRL